MAPNSGEFSYRPQDAGYTEDLITQHALEFMRANQDRPFFCYVPFHIVHAPFQAQDSDLQSVDARVWFRVIGSCCILTRGRVNTRKIERRTRNTAWPPCGVPRTGRACRRGILDLAVGRTTQGKSGY